MRKLLEFQSDRIEHVLTAHRVDAKVTGGTVTPRWVSFKVIPTIGTKISQICGLSDELAAALDADNCRISRRGAAVAIEIPRDDPQPVRLMPLYHQLVESNTTAIPPITAVLGLAEDGAPLLIRLPSPDVAHILVAGTTGSGKTMLLQVLALTIAMENLAPMPGQDDNRSCAFVMIDPKKRAFRQMSALPHLARPVITTIEDATEALHSLVRLMERRDTAVTNKPRIIVMIDELADLLMLGGKNVQTAITRLTQRGRESGIHVVAATQKPTSAVLGPLVKANFPVRLVGRVTSTEDARTATGWSGTGAERLLGRGDFVAIAEGRVIRFQVAHVSDEEINKIVATVKQKSARHQPSITKRNARPRNGLRAAITGLMPKRQRPEEGIQTVGKAQAMPPPDEVIRQPPVLPHVEQPEALAPDDEYRQRLEEMDWDPKQSFRAACRKLNVAQGGKPFRQVREAVKQMRAAQGLSKGEKNMEQARQAITFVTGQGSSAPPSPATATATEEKSPKAVNGDDEAFVEYSGRVVALENQGDNKQDTSELYTDDDVDHTKSVVIGMAAEVSWLETPHDIATNAVKQLAEYIDVEGEQFIWATTILVETIRSDRMTASVNLKQ